VRPSFHLAIGLLLVILAFPPGRVGAELPPGLAGGGMKGNDAYLEGSFFLTAPLRSTIGDDRSLNGSLWLLEPYVSWGEGGERATSLGLAWRHLCSQQPVSAMNGSSRNGGGVFERDALHRALRLTAILRLDPRAQQGLKQVFFGATVTYARADDSEHTVTLVGVDEVDVDRARISWLSPVATALMKAKVGDTVRARMPGGVEALEVVKIVYPIDS
jgi:hypothetical protein